MTRLNSQNHLCGDKHRSRKATTQRDLREKEENADLCDIETSKVFLKDVSFYQKVEEITAAHKLQNLSK
jgi:hypothetical protein